MWYSALWAIREVIKVLGIFSVKEQRNEKTNKEPNEENDDSGLSVVFKYEHCGKAA